MNRPAPSRARLLLTATCAALGGALAWWHWGGLPLAVLASITGALWLLAVLAPRAYLPVFRVLDGFVQALLQAVTWTLLGLVFILVFVPGRLLLALRRVDPLDRDGRTRKTAWHDARPAPDPDRHFRAQY